MPVSLPSRTLASRRWLAAAVLALGAVAAARADKLAPPPEALKDFQGEGCVVLDLPPDPGGQPGFTFWVETAQSYVWPDRFLIERSGEVTLVQSNIEMTYSPAAKYIFERVYKNLDKAPENPITAYQLSMATYARLLAELKEVKILPDEDLDKVAAEEKAKIAAAESERQAIKKKMQVDDLPKVNSLSAQMVLLKNDLDQIPLRRSHPCTLVEVDNPDLMKTLLAKGLLGGRNAAFLEKGKTVFKVTKNEGLPIRIDTMDNGGHVVLSFCFSELRINNGLRPGDLVLKAPPGTRTLTAMADVTEHDWAEKMEKDLQRRRDAVEALRQPAAPARPGRKKPG